MMNDAMAPATDQDGRPVVSNSSRSIMKFRYPTCSLPTALATDRQQMRWWAIYSHILAYDLHNRAFRSLAEFADVAGVLYHAPGMALEYRDNSLLLCAR